MQYTREEIEDSVSSWINNSVEVYSFVQGCVNKALKLKRKDPVMFATERAWGYLKNLVTFDGVLVRKYAIKVYIENEIKEIEWRA